MALTVVVCALTGVVLSVVWLWLMRHVPKQLIYASMVAQAVLWLVMAAYMVYVGAFFGAILGMLGLLITVVFWYWNRHRIPFAAAILSTVATVTKQFPGTIWCVAVALVLQVIWAAVWSYTSVGSFFWAEGAVGYVVYIFLLLSLYWTAEVIRNTTHVTIAGVFATWYFMG